jgi:hypothetical protein
VNALYETQLSDGSYFAAKKPQGLSSATHVSLISEQLTSSPDYSDVKKIVDKRIIHNQIDINVLKIGYINNGNTPTRIITVML